MIGADAQTQALNQNTVDQSPVIAQMITRQHKAAQNWAAANTTATGAFVPGGFTTYDTPWGLAHCMDDEAGSIATYDNGNLNAETPSYVISELQKINSDYKAGYYQAGNVVFGSNTVATMPINCPVLTDGTLVLVSSRVQP